MIDEQRSYFYCMAHKPATPDGYKSGINFDPQCKCEHRQDFVPCGEIAEVVIFPKPLNYPRLSTA